MFQSKKIDLNQTDTLIGQQTVIEGNIDTKASVRVEGKIRGDIICDGDCTIGEKGLAESNIQARNIFVAGEVQGDITANEKLIIHKSGVLHGNATTQSIVIEEGGKFFGSSLMKTTVKSHEEDAGIENRKVAAAVKPGQSNA